MGLYNFQCPSCFFKSKLYPELIKHYLNSHKNDNNFQICCKKCNHKFKVENTFHQHLRRAHQIKGSINDYLCIIPKVTVTDDQMQVNLEVTEDSHMEIDSIGTDSENQELQNPQENALVPEHFMKKNSCRVFDQCKRKL